MSSKKSYTTNTAIQCPSCGKTMLLKNWKSHSLQMHSMSQTVIDMKYIELKRIVEKSRSETINGSATTSNQSAEELLVNPLIQKYSSRITYKHKGVDGKVYERTDEPLLNMEDLKHDVHAFRKITKDTSISLILRKLAKNGSEQCPEWFRLYQILGTFAVGFNEVERAFSSLKRTKSYLRNRLSDSTIEMLLKISSLNLELTDEAISFIIQDFIKNPGRVKARNITLFFENGEDKEQDEELF